MEKQLSTQQEKILFNQMEVEMDLDKGNLFSLKKLNRLQLLEERWLIRQEMVLTKTRLNLFLQVKREDIHHLNLKMKKDRKKIQL